MTYNYDEFMSNFAGVTPEYACGGKAKKSKKACGGIKVKLSQKGGKTKTPKTQKTSETNKKWEPETNEDWRPETPAINEPYYQELKKLYEAELQSYSAPEENPFVRLKKSAKLIIPKNKSNKLIRRALSFISD